jgi:lambda repressor-like predicted transcriptional regulator
MGENGKHEQIVADILSALRRIQKNEALQITSAQLGGSKAQIRSVLYRAARKSGRKIATSTDADSLYVWKRFPIAQRSPTLRTNHTRREIRLLIVKDG